MRRSLLTTAVYAATVVVLVAIYVGIEAVIQ